MQRRVQGPTSPKCSENWLIVASGDVTAKLKPDEVHKTLREAEIWPGRHDPRRDKLMSEVGEKGRGKERRLVWYQGMAQQVFCQPCLTSLVVSQLDTTVSDRDGSGFSIRPSVCTSVPPGNGRDMGKHGISRRREQLGLSANAGISCRGLWLYWDHWNSGYTGTGTKGRAHRHDGDGIGTAWIQATQGLQSGLTPATWQVSCKLLC